MAAQTQLDLPPGFEKMSRQEQIEYAQRLWEYISPKPDEVPVPDWQLDLVRERIRQHRETPSKVSSWEDVQNRMLSKYGQEHG